MPGLLRAPSILTHVPYPIKPTKSLHKKRHMGRLRTATDSRRRPARTGTRLVTRRQASAGRGRTLRRWGSEWLSRMGVAVSEQVER